MCLLLFNKNMSWLSNVIRKNSQKKRDKKTSYAGYDGNRSLTPAWRILPDADESSHDNCWDITKTHNQWVPVGVKTYENSSTYIGRRLFKPDFENGHWYRQSHFFFKLEELTCFATLLGFADQSAIEASGMNVHYPQDFARAIEVALSNGITCGGGRDEGVESPGMSSFSKKLGAGKKILTKLPPKILKTSGSPEISKKRGNTGHMSKDELATASKKENDHPSNTVEVEMHPQSAQEKTGESGRMGANNGVHHVEQCMEICGADDEDDDNVFLN